MAKKTHKELVSEAEQAVSSVKDPNLKQIAFQKVLDDLLASGNDSEEPAAKKAKTTAKAKSGSTRGTSKGGPTQYVQELADDGYFSKKPKTISEVKAELANRAHHIPIPVLSMTLMRLCRSKILRRTKEKGKGVKNTYLYSDW